MRQLSLFQDVVQDQAQLTYSEFSHNGVCSEIARAAIEGRYHHLLRETDEFSRRTVSFQANKTNILHSWMKYREGFSADLVETLIRKSLIKPGDTILEPFAGSCTTLLVAMMSGINATGIELLPHCHLAWEAKRRAFDYDLDELRHIRALVESTPPPSTDIRFPHISITESAFPDDTERDLMAYTMWGKTLDLSDDARVLWQLILVSVLEDISHTRKDGQYLRWDTRARKIQDRNERRVTSGQVPITGIDKGSLPTVKEAFLRALAKIIVDVAELRKDPPPPSSQELMRGNTLFTLPTLEADQFAGVITSPPYANRYDYTRTYALELAYLGIGDEIFRLRQNQLSCTVENRSKLDEIGSFYRSIGQLDRHRQIMTVIEQNAALAEIGIALQERNRRGEINNAGVLPMVVQYFTELTFVFAELHRVCRSGARVAFVNDSVRYAGEIIPVDVLSTNLAEQVGFEPETIYVLTQRKGNSSQQMGKFGRVALRKSITVWHKP